MRREIDKEMLPNISEVKHKRYLKEKDRKERGENERCVRGGRHRKKDCERLRSCELEINRLIVNNTH